MSNNSKSYNKSIWSFGIIKQALLDALLKFSFFHQIRNPVMFTVYVGALMTIVLFFLSLGGKEKMSEFIFWITLWLWVTLFFANFAEAMAEGRGKTQAQALRKTRQEIDAKKLDKPKRNASYTLVPSADLRVGDIVLVETGDFIPGDGEIIEGIASVNESAITGESAPVIRESGGDRNAVTGGTQVISDWLVIKIVANPGETFLDQMISLVEGAKRQKTPNELALTILLATLTIIFLLVCASLLPFSLYSVFAAHKGEVISIAVLIALFVCLAPTTIGALLSAIGIAGMDRMIQANVIALSGRAVEAAGDIDVLLMDKTGTITLGNREATEFIPAEGVDMEALANAAQLASLSDQTPEGRSIVVLAKKKYGLRGRKVEGTGATFIPFTAQTRMSGVNIEGRQIRKGSEKAIEEYIKELGGTIPDSVRKSVKKISRAGGTPILVAEGKKVLGIINLKDIVKGGIKERFAEQKPQVG